MGSLASAVTTASDVYQPFSPCVPLTFPLIVGACVSTFAEVLPIAELSPKLEIAQNVKLFAPSESGTFVHEFPAHANVVPFSVPSMLKMEFPATGSFDVMFK